ncbi:transcription-associated protein 1 [Marasmius crinis-equi]|uniref:Transcription-associated protein 1 n=1 Tax=Marasmius crinis-equi TaxID=585013 RepID=A0ABR3F2H6_9AGAR
MSEMCTRLLSEDSEVMDPNVALPGLRSFKAMAELGLRLVMVMFTRAMRQLTPAVKATIDPTFGVVEMDSPAQKKAREDIEVLHFTTVIIQHYSSLVSHLQKDLLQWSWGFTVSEDHIVKQTAYLLTARFFAVFQSPYKLISRT